MPTASPRLDTGSEQPATAVLCDHRDVLIGQRAPVRSPFQRHGLRTLTTQRAVGLTAAHVAEADKRPTAEIGDQEADVLGSEGLG